MTPKEKALELYRKYRGFNNETEEINKTTAIQCAELCVDEIILSSPRSPLFSDKYDKESDSFVDMSTYEYWITVKEQLNNL